jgi:hypothetical protein
MRRTAVLLFFASAALAVHAGPARAGDPAPDPAAAYAKLCASLPAPSADGGLSFEGVVQIGGKSVGYASLDVHPAPGDATQWEAVDRLVVKPNGVPQSKVTTVRMTRALEPLSGHTVSSGSPPRTLKWERTSDGFRVLAPGPGQTAREFPHQGSTLSTVAATILLVRAALPGPGTYATSVLSLDEGMEGKPAFQAAQFQILGKKTLQGKDVLVVTGKAGERELTVLFHPETKAVVGVRMVRGTTTLQIVRGDKWSMPAHDVRTAALRAALGFATADLHLLDDVFYWPRVTKAYQAAHATDASQKPVSLDQLRAGALAHWSKGLQKRPAAMVAPMVESMRDQLKVETLPDKRVRVILPPTFGNMRLVLAPVDGVWYLVELPTKPHK